MGQQVNGAPAPPERVLSVPLRDARAHPAGPLVARVTEADDVSRAGDLPLDRLVWIEVPLPLAEAPWPVGAPLDVVVLDPVREAAGLYVLDRVRRHHPVRVTVAGRPGLGRGARLAMALQLPVRLMALQPSPEVLADLDEVLEIYLHDSQANAPVELLQSALAWSLFGDAPSAWAALELDPDWHLRLGHDGASVPAVCPPREPGFVSRWTSGLVEGGAECATCRHREWCRGFFKWPDAAYDCAGVVRLLGRIEENAARLSRDLDEARELAP